jgi:hypothetical protein
MYRIEFTPEALEDLVSLRNFDLRRVVDETEVQLRAMKTIELTDASPDIAKLLDQARVEDIVVRVADGSEFLLVAVDDFDREIARTRANPRLMALLESRAKQTTTVSLEEAKRRLGL